MLFPPPSAASTSLICKSIYHAAFGLATLDYCNSVMAELPASSLAPLNRLLSAVVRLVAGLGPRDHITEHMKRLHWLPIVSD